MAEPTNSLASLLGQAAFYAALAPLLVGGSIAIFKTFIRSDDDLKKDVRLKKEILLERVSKSYQTLLERVNQPLMGTPPENPDLFGAHVKELFRIFESHQRLNALRKGHRHGYALLCTTSLLGVIAALVGFAWSDAKPYVAVFGFLLLGTQGTAIYYLRGLCRQLEDFEEVM